MKNNYIKNIVISFIFVLIVLIGYSVIHFLEYKAYTNNFNNKIESIVVKVKEKYPDVTSNEIIQLLNNESIDNNLLFKEYGIDINKDSLVLINDKKANLFLIINITIIILIILIIYIFYIIQMKKNDKDIDEIINCIEQINKKNYELKMELLSEGRLSLLKDEIYKTTIMLKEEADNSKEDKIKLKKSMEDISHQLKTPLTSILILVDNLIDDPDMDKEVRNDFIKDIKRNIFNINFLVQALLKLTKFDANTVSFNKQEESLKSIINESIKNVSPLCDLRNINLKFKMKNDVKIICDAKWQIEAISNVLKNSIEHSKDSSSVIINTDNNSVYSMIEIIDNGEGISKKDISHIFERFYKSEKSKSDSMGIGLSLAKAIIEEDKGTITVDSNEKETKFTIKYYKI